MKRVLLTLFLLCAVWGLPVQADYTTTRFTLEESNISIQVNHPNNFLENEKEGLDVCLRHVEDKGHILAFHFFPSSEFDFTRFNEVFEYGEWLANNLFGDNAPRRSTKFTTRPHEARFSFITTDEFGKEVHCTMVFGKIDNRIVYSNIATSYLSLDEASLRNENFLKTIYWGTAKSITGPAPIR